LVDIYKIHRCIDIINSAFTVEGSRRGPQMNPRIFADNLWNLCIRWDCRKV